MHMYNIFIWPNGQDVKYDDVSIDLLLQKLHDQDQDLWQDAQMPEVISYLRGSRKLKIPEAYKMRIPRFL